jgi:hypothetical protein
MNIPVTKKAVEAAIVARKQYGDEAANRGDIALKGSTRRAVICAAIASLSAKEREAISASLDAEIHRWIASVLKESGCLLDSVDGYMKTIQEMGVVESHAPCVLGPASVRRALAAIDKEEAKAKSAPAPKTPKAPKTPPKKAKEAAPA